MTQLAMPANQFIYAADPSNFEQLVLENSRRGLVLVDFWSPRAGPSLRQREMLSKLAEAMAGRFLLVTVNTDEQKKLADDFGVRSLPSFKLFRNGKVVEEVRGIQPEADYRGIVERHLAGTTDRIQQAALANWQAGQREKALQILAEAAVNDPGNPKLPLLMAKLLMQQGRHGDALEVLEAVPEPACDDPELSRMTAHLAFIAAAEQARPIEQLGERVASVPDDWAARYQLAAVLLTQDDFEGAMEQLMAIQRAAPDYDKGAARKGLLALFHMLDAGDERVKRYRSELFNLSH